MTDDPRKRAVDPKKCTHGHEPGMDDPVCIPCHRREALFDACEDVCPMCASHPHYERAVDGPNASGSYIHSGPVGVPTRCLASAIWNRIMEEERKIQAHLSGGSR